MKKWVTYLLLALFCLPVSGQSEEQEIGPRPFFAKNSPDVLKIDRLDVLGLGRTKTHTAIRRYSDRQLAGSGPDTNTLRKGLFNVFYQHPDHLYLKTAKDFSLGLNLMLNLQVGRDSRNSETIYLNKRGIELYGTLDQKLYFYTAYEENQSNLLSYRLKLLNDYAAIRGKGNYKNYQSGIFDSVQGYDYGFATAYLGYKLSKHTALEIGHNQHFIGNGIRSILLSDTGNNYFNVRFEAKFWKIHYQSIFAELSSISARYNRGNRLLPKKYMVNHYLSIKPIENMELGIFEAIIFSRENHFELQYLNPVIFYRTLEHQLDSPDNVLLGVNGKWNPFRRFSLYGQLLLDEFRINEIFSNEGWWGNKYALQLGLKYINVLGINKLDAQLEYNRVRPFTYSHWKAIEDFDELTVSNYSHFNQPLAHPLGANFTEQIFILRYQPIEKIYCEAKLIYTKQGLNEIAQNFGADILINNSSRSADYDQQQNQGTLNTISIAELNLSYELTRNLFLDFQLLIRSESATSLTNNFINGGLRYNVGRTRVDY